MDIKMVGRREFAKVFDPLLDCSIFLQYDDAIKLLDKYAPPSHKAEVVEPLILLSSTMYSHSVAKNSNVLSSLYSVIIVIISYPSKLLISSSIEVPKSLSFFFCADATNSSHK